MALFFIGVGRVSAADHGSQEQSLKTPHSPIAAFLTRTGLRDAAQTGRGHLRAFVDGFSSSVFFLCPAWGLVSLGILVKSDRDQTVLRKDWRRKAARECL